MAAKARTQEVSPRRCRQAIRDADVLIDVREADEFAAGTFLVRHIMSPACSEFKLSGGDLDLSARDLKLVVYCRNQRPRGPRRLHAARHGKHLHVKSIAGGFDAWTSAGKVAAKPSLPNFD